MQDGRGSDQAEWPPEPGALHGQVWRDPDDARPTIILLVHPGTPFVRPASLDDQVAIQRVAHEYLVGVVRALDLPLPAWWLLALDPDCGPQPGFGWLPVFHPDKDEAPRPIASVVVENIRRKRPTSRTLILLAAERNGDLVLGSEFGIRVVVHAFQLPDRTQWIRITGFSASLPFGDYRSEAGDDLFLLSAAEVETLQASLITFRNTIALKLGLQSHSTFFRGFRFGRPDARGRRIEMKGRGLAVSQGAEPFAFLVETRASGGSLGADLLSCRKTLLSACMAQAPARVLRSDPASHDPPELWRCRRPTRSEATLDATREPEPQAIPLRIPGSLDVVQTWYVRGDNPNGPDGGVKKVQLSIPVPPVRSNNFTAVSTFRNLRQLFERFDIYQIPRLKYFQHASLPLKAHYRSGVRPGWGKNGQTINGRVLPQGWPPDAVFVPAAADRPLLHVHLALGNLSTRARQPLNSLNPSPAEPLGFAADPRWIWHEISHVLLMAALGELEFRFAHSMGDGLAAIVADPHSKLADNPRWRGYTFPWIFVPRRHDRCVLHGWGWNGQLGRPLRDVPENNRLHQKGYLTEQILSTSLFRMYRCLGGDTVKPGTREADPQARQLASDYAVYLIMEALRLLGDPAVVPAARAELFVAALINADERMETETFPPGAPALDRVPWTGGCTHKAICWAFQAQGMHAGAGIENAPGVPPDVDIYVEDRRQTIETFPDAQIEHGPGSYVPVSLDWAGLPAAPEVDVVPGWFALAAAMERTNGGMAVKVGNRGTLAAAKVTVRLWHNNWPVGQDPPLWNQAVWTAAGTEGPQNIPSSQSRVFVGFGPLAALLAAPGRHLVLAEAVCVTDRANNDPTTNLPCSRRPTPLHELVPMDNNLGLTVIKVP